MVGVQNDLRINVHIDVRVPFALAIALIISVLGHGVVSRNGQ